MVSDTTTQFPLYSPSLSLTPMSISNWIDDVGRLRRCGMTDSRCSILLLNSGKLAEIDAPKNLLAKSESYLSTLIAVSADADELRAIANEKI
jgi:hypothetical protein